MKASARFAWLVLSEAERAEFLEAVRPGVRPEHFERIRAMVEAFPELLELFEDQDMSLERLRKLAFGAATEKTDRVCAPKEPSSPQAQPPKPGRQCKGHGRAGTRAYTGARRIQVAHPALKPGQACPACKRGKLRRQPRPAKALHLEGQPPITASVYELEVLRCSLCGKTFTAAPPPQAGTEKYDPSVGVIVALLRYGSGMPAYRLEQWQASMGVPLPSSTQWQLVDELARVIEPVHELLEVLAAQAQVLFNDDTGMRVEQLRRQIRSEDKPKRTGIFTTGIVAEGPEHLIALFFTGREHAGENLNRILEHRQEHLPPPLQMCDGLSRNEPRDYETLLACCLAHGRRAFVDIASRFPEECRRVLESIRAVYHCDAQARQKGLSDKERLLLHQSQSGPVMEELKTWLDCQIDQKQVEPNSALGQAIGFMRGHWMELTRFLHEPGAPLDNNLCERILKTAILHRKNSLSYKTERGARVGDRFMSLIQTCRLNRVNPFDYLMALATHSAEVKAQPEQWLPWNFGKAKVASSSSNTS